MCICIYVYIHMYIYNSLSLITPSIGGATNGGRGGGRCSRDILQPVAGVGRRFTRGGARAHRHGETLAAQLFPVAKVISIYMYMYVFIYIYLYIYVCIYIYGSLAAGQGLIGMKRLSQPNFFQWLR